MNKALLTRVVCAVALLLLVFFFGARLLMDLIAGVRRVGEMPVEPVIAEDPWAEPDENDSFQSDYFEDILAADEAADEAPVETTTPEPMVQVPVLETPEQLAGQS